MIIKSNQIIKLNYIMNSHSSLLVKNLINTNIIIISRDKMINIIKKAKIIIHITKIQIKLTIKGLLHRLLI